MRLMFSPGLLDRRGLSPAAREGAAWGSTTTLVLVLSSLFPGSDPNSQSSCYAIVRVRHCTIHYLPQPSAPAYLHCFMYALLAGTQPLCLARALSRLLSLISQDGGAGFYCFAYIVVIALDYRKGRRLGRLGRWCKRERGKREIRSD